VKNFKFQISNFKLVMPLLMVILMMFAFGCQNVDKPVRGEEGAGPMVIVIDGDAPDSHIANTTSEGNSLRKTGLFSSSLRGLDYWKAYHPTLVTGTHNPGLIVATEDEEEMCLDCHDQSTSCNNCNGYVGVKLITSSEE
jgi:hypothetical protein